MKPRFNWATHIEDTPEIVQNRWNFERKHGFCRYSIRGLNLAEQALWHYFGQFRCSDHTDILPTFTGAVWVTSPYNCHSCTPAGLNRTSSLYCNKDTCSYYFTLDRRVIDTLARYMWKRNKFGGRIEPEVIERILGLSD